MVKQELQYSPIKSPFELKKRSSAKYIQKKKQNKTQGTPRKKAS